MTRAAVGVAVALAGCAQILGLDPTKPPATDAGADAGGVCSDQPRCTGSGRQVCGQLVQTGSAAGLPLRVAAPTGSACPSTVTADGPCALTANGGSIDQISAGSGLVPGSIDDCGRFVVDLSPTFADVAVVFDGIGFARTGCAVVGRPAASGSDVVAALAVTNDTEAAWSSELGSADTSTGFLVLYTEAGDVPLANEQAASDGSSPFSNPPGTTPWAAYFTGAFDALAASATHTGSAGAAFVVPGQGSAFSLQGFRTGKRCAQDGVRQINGTLMFVVETGC